MHAAIVFLTPLGGLVALAVVFPLAAAALATRRVRGARELLGLPAPAVASRLPQLLVLVAVPTLLGLAATQPALRSQTSARVRTDAQAFFVLDNSRSMLAAQAPGAPTRFARAKQAAIAMRAAIPDVPAGVATLTDRVLPNLLPNPDPAVLDGTVERAVAVGQPPPQETGVTATTLAALGALGTANFFPATVTRRLVVVLTDGESRPFDVRQVARALAAGPGIHLVLVHVWAPGEAVYDQGRLEQGYHEAPASGEALDSLAVATGGAAFGEQALGAAIRTAKADLGTGPTVVQGRDVQTRTLAPYVALVALLPLFLLVKQRWPRSRRRVPADDDRSAKGEG